MGQADQVTSATNIWSHRDVLCALASRDGKNIESFSRTKGFIESNVSGGEKKAIEDDVYFFPHLDC